MVPAAGVEPATFRSGGERSNPLSYAGLSWRQKDSTVPLVVANSVPFSSAPPEFRHRDAGTAGVLACICYLHVLLGHTAGEDACGPSITTPEFWKGVTKGYETLEHPMDHADEPKG